MPDSPTAARTGQRHHRHVQAADGHQVRDAGPREERHCSAESPADPPPPAPPARRYRPHPARRCGNKRSRTASRRSTTVPRSGHEASRPVVVGPGAHSPLRARSPVPATSARSRNHQFTLPWGRRDRERQRSPCIAELLDPFRRRHSPGTRRGTAGRGTTAGSGMPPPRRRNHAAPAPRRGSSHDARSRPRRGLPTPGRVGSNCPPPRPHPAARPPARPAPPASPRLPAAILAARPAIEPHWQATTTTGQNAKSKCRKR